MLEQLSPVRTFQWDPQQPRLAICTGGSRLYLWSPAGCMSVQVPGEGEHIPKAMDVAGLLCAVWRHTGGTVEAQLLSPALRVCINLKAGTQGTCCPQLYGLEVASP